MIISDASQTHPLRFVSYQQGDTMQKRIRSIGHISLEDDAILITKPFQTNTIPYQRVTSVSSSLTEVQIETGAQVHTINLWSPGAAREIADNIRSRIT